MGGSRRETQTNHLRYWTPVARVRRGSIGGLSPDHRRPKAQAIATVQGAS